MSRKPIIAGNWKMNKNPEEAKAFVEAVKYFFDITIHEIKDIIQGRITDNFERLNTQFSF